MKSVIWAVHPYNRPSSWTKSVEKRWGLKNGRMVTDNCLSVTIPVPRAGIEELSGSEMG